ncbi:MAG: glutamate ligase domain-containing protein [Candidatus Nanohalobium sp.]
MEKEAEGPLKLRYAGETFESGLKAGYQIENMNTAIEAIERSGLEAQEEAVIAALNEINVPGRMEKISERPELFVDGAHNKEGMKALTSSIDSFDTMVFGCMEKKPYRDMIGLLRPHTENMIFTRPEKDHAWNPESVEDGKIVENPFKAVKAAEGCTRVTGSLYLAGAIREKFRD